MLYSLLKLSAKDIAKQQSKTAVLQTLICLKNWKKIMLYDLLKPLPSDIAVRQSVGRGFTG